MKRIYVLMVPALLIPAQQPVRANDGSSPGTGSPNLVPMTGKQLFVDDYIIAKKSGLTRELGAIRRENDGKPIFTDGWFYGTVLHDQGKFRLWYRKPGRGGYGLAESANGIRFKKVADVKGINFAGDYTLSVSRDPNAKKQPTYLAAYDGPGMRAAIAHSRNGIDWTPFNKGQPVTHRAADTYNQIIWDQAAKTYRLFTRTDFGSAGGAGEWRGSRSMTNPDIWSNPKQWKTVRSWVFNRNGNSEQKRRQIYALTDWIYHGVHFALMSVYEHPGDLSEGPADLRKRHNKDVMNFYVATSRDGDQWDLSWVYAGKPMIPRGPEGAFDNDMLFPASTIVTHKDKHWLYYGGANERHGISARKHAIGLATLRLDGFVALKAGAHGSLLTKPFRLPKGALYLNTDARNGELNVEIIDAAGKTIATSDAIRGDHLKAKLTFDKAIPPGRIVSLKLNLKTCRIYSLWFK